LEDLYKIARGWAGWVGDALDKVGCIKKNIYIKYIYSFGVFIPSYFVLMFNFYLFDKYIQFKANWKKNI
jgi:hypothetical protein